MNKQQALKTYIEFYSNKENMIKIYDNASLNRKEFAFYNKSFKNYQMKRHFGICTFEFFQDVIRFNCLNWCKQGINKMYNLYYSMVVYDRPLPNLAFMGKNRDLRWSFEETMTYIKSIPLVIDLDSDSLEDLKLHAEYIIKICKRLSNPKVYFTGMGFHIYDDELGNKFNNDLKMITGFVQELKDNVTEFIDMKIYDYRRILKIPNSLAVYEDFPDEFRMFIVSEISLNELKNFDYKNYEVTWKDKN